MTSGHGVTRPKVLAVDDRPENLVALQAILEGLAVDVVAVGGGEDALKQLLVDDFAVILLDAHMPGMDGFETAEHIKRRERTRHVPILFLTAVDYDPHLAFRGYQAGAVDYISKPFDPWVLRSKVSVFVDLWAVQSELAARAAENDVAGHGGGRRAGPAGRHRHEARRLGRRPGPRPHPAGRGPRRPRLIHPARVATHWRASRYKRARESLRTGARVATEWRARCSYGLASPVWGSSAVDRLSPLVGVNVVRPRCAAGAAR